MSLGPTTPMTSPAGELPKQISELLKRLGESMKRDPRKAWVLTVLAAVLAVLLGRLLLGGRGPADALASRPLIAAPAVAGGRAVRKGEPALPLAEWARKAPGPLDRNLFTVPYDYYPQDGSRAPQPVLSSADDRFWDQLAKSVSVQADQKKERQILVENLRMQAAALALQGTVLGTQPRAWVNGSLVGVGEDVGSSGFRVVRIEARRIIVEREGVRLEIPMK